MTGTDPDADTDTVTITRAEYDALLELIEDLEDALAMAERRSDPTFPFEVVEPGRPR